MAESLSGHLIDSFLQAQQPLRGPFGQPISAPNAATHGTMSFAPSMHGTSSSGVLQAPTFSSEQYFRHLSEENAKKTAALQVKLEKKLGPEYISQRPGPGGGMKLTYVEGWKIINLANEVFGFNGWSSNVVSMTTDFIDFNEQSQRYTVGVSAIIRVTLRDGVFHEDVGYGMLENSKSKGAALDKCKKEAVTDGVKRALRNFGNLLGNCLYDKQYAQEIVKVKVPPPKFDKSELHRRPEFEERKPDVSVNASTAGPSGSTSRLDVNISVDTAQQPEIPRKPLSSVPPHMRAPSGANTHSAASSAAKGKSPIGLAEHATPVRPNNVPQSKLGLNTPEHTPAHPAPVQRTNLPTKPGVVHRQPPTKAERQQLPIPDAANVKRAEATSGSKETDSTVAASPPGPEDDPLLLDSGSHEEYGMNSDDDDFFATVDLGEGDTGIGGHIDFDEGTGGVDLEVSFDQQPSPLEAVKQPRTLAQSSKPLQPAGPGPRIQNAAANMQEKASAGNAASRAGNIPTRTPSMGGFHFPPGYHSKLSQPPAAIAGSKRTADIMQGAGPRRPLQGMGLSHQPIPVPTTGKREPLAQLDVEGGDVKRVRR